MSSFLVAFVLLCLGLNLPGFADAGSNESFVFSGFAGAGASLILDGTAMITREGLLELTNNEADVKGHVFHPTKVQFKDSPNGTVLSFSVTFIFAIIVSASNAFSSDGMAFIVAPEKDFSNAAWGQYLGFLNSTTNNGPAAAAAASSNHIFAVELDTVRNAEFQDIDNNHVGIDINTLSSVHSTPAAFYDDREGGRLKNLTLSSGDAMQVWIDYDGNAMEINVTLAPMAMRGGARATKPSKPLLSYTSDLKDVLTDKAYVGFSGATGPVGSQHCLLAWSFAVNGPAPPIDFKKIPKLPNSGQHEALVKDMEIGLPIAAFVLILATCITVILLVRRHLTYAELREDWEVEFGPHRFSYKDLFKATEGFKNKHLLGSGGFGKVYKGVLPKSGTEVAVKRVSHDSTQGMKEFISEVVSIGHLRHRNLVQLLGYCRRKGELLPGAGAGF